MPRNYLRRYSANHSARHPRDFDRIEFQELPKGITVSCVLVQDGGCEGHAKWVVATELGAPVIMCTYHTDRVCAALAVKGVRYERTPIPYE